MTISSMLAGAAAAFDVDAATRAYLAMVQGPARARSDAYFEGGYWLLLWGALLTVAVNWALLHFGWSARWSAWAGRIARRPALRTMLYALPYIATTSLLVMPWTIYTRFFREHQYGMSNLSFGAWAAEQFIDLAITLVVGALILAAIFAVIRRFPRSWWLWGTGVTTAFLTLGILISPVFIAPLFNTYKPMPDSPLRTEIIAMAKAQGIPANDVFVFDASRQTDRISANVSGLGPTIRISLNDNLLNRTGPEEVKAVMGHEMGHYVLGHGQELLLFTSLIFLGVFLLLWWLSPLVLARYGARWGVRQVSDPAVLPLFAIIMSLAMLFATPLTNSLTRWNEIEADRFGLDAAREPDGFAKVAMRLSEYRKLEPHPLEEAIFFTHPSGENRARMSMEWKAKHLTELAAEDRVIKRPAPLPVKTAE